MSYLLLIIPLSLGWLAGWLVNYLADVLPYTRKFSRPACHHCEAPFAPADYLFFRKCSKCEQSRGWRPILTQLFAMALFVYIWIKPPGGMGFVIGFIVLTFFGVVTVIDLEHRLILHPVSLVGIGVGLLAGITRNGLAGALLGGLAGVGVMGVMYLGGVLFSKMRARRMGVDDGEEAMGFGDVALATVLGLILGWPQILGGLILGILLGGSVSLLVILGLFVTGKYKTLSFFLPYGPFLISGASLLLFF